MFRCQLSRYERIERKSRLSLKYSLVNIRKNTKAMTMQTMNYHVHILVIPETLREGLGISPERVLCQVGGYVFYQIPMRACHWYLFW